MYAQSPRVPAEAARRCPTVLNVWRLQLLREVARRGTIAAAASAMNVSPSAVSQQLGVLEREVGTKLLERAGRTVRLTDSGRLLVRHADAITGAIASAEADLATIREVVAGEFRIAAFPTAARALMPAVMTALGQRYPALRLTLRDLEANESLEALGLGEIDLAIVDEYESVAPRPEPGSAAERHTVLADPLYLALPPGHSLADRPVALSELGDEYWVMDTEASHFFQMALQALRANGVEPHIRSHCKDFSVIIALVEAGVGIALLPGLALHDRKVRAVIHPTRPPLARTVIAAVSPERRAHPAVATTLEELDRVGRSYRVGRRR